MVIELGQAATLRAQRSALRPQAAATSAVTMATQHPIRTVFPLLPHTVVFPPLIVLSTGATAYSTSTDFTNQSLPVLAADYVTRTTSAVILLDRQLLAICRSSKDSLQQRYEHCEEGPRCS